MIDVLGRPNFWTTSNGRRFGSAELQQVSDGASPSAHERQPSRLLENGRQAFVELGRALEVGLGPDVRRDFLPFRVADDFLAPRLVLVVAEDGVGRGRVLRHVR